MAQWHRNIQDIITIMDGCIRTQQDEALTLRALADRLGYSEYYTSRRLRALAGMTLRDYLRLRRLAFALRDVRDTDRRLLDIAVKYGQPPYGFPCLKNLSAKGRVEPSPKRRRPRKRNPAAQPPFSLMPIRTLHKQEPSSLFFIVCLRSSPTNP